MNSPLTAILTVVYKNIEMLDALLTSLDVLEGNFILIVVDNSVDRDISNEIAKKLKSMKRAKRYLEIKEDPKSNFSWDSETLEGTLLLFISSSNEGYGAGNNHGLRTCLTEERIKYFWLLNNDTIVSPKALVEMLKYAAELDKQGVKWGPMGATFLDYHQPDLVRVMGGGFYDPISGYGKLFCENIHIRDLPQDAPKLSMIYGASMFVSREFVQKVGLVEEQFFLCSEEIDWCVRARKLGFQTVWAREAHIRHIESATMGQESRVRHYYCFRSRILFLAKHKPYALPLHYIISFGIIAKSLLRGRFLKAKMHLLALLFPHRKLSD